MKNIDEQLKNNGGRKTSDGIMFKKVDKKVLKAQTDRVNKVIKYLKSNLIKTNNLIRAASVWNQYYS